MHQTSLFQFCIFVVSIPLSVFCLMHQGQDPCAQWLAQGNRCNYTHECRLVQPNYCMHPGCFPTPTCAPRMPRVSSCGQGNGDPVLDSNFRPLSCYPGRNCPPSTSCNTQVMDTQTTCCWTPPAPPRPTFPAYNPCLGVQCRTGTTCVARPPTNCYGPRPCSHVPSCEAITPAYPPAPPTNTNPCATVRCRPAYHCESRTTCSPHRPCVTKALCVLNMRPPTTVDPNACPALTGKLPCDMGCETDTDCDPGYRCCKHSCGAVCTKPGAAVTSPTPVSPPAPLTHPCKHQNCPYGQECRLRQVHCLSAPCAVSPTCGPVTRHPPEPQCPVHLPALDLHNRELFCGRGPGSVICPPGTFCNTHPTNRFAVCCHDDQAVPAVTTLTPSFNKCQNVRCPAGQVCREETTFCFTTPCPGPRAVCRSTTKPGTCPAPRPGQMGPCVVKCSSDADCSGNFKCCGSCPRECATPTSPRPTSPVQSACAMIRCYPNYKCVEKVLHCPSPPCPLKGECVPSFTSPSPTPPPTSPNPVTKPGFCPAPTGYGNCANMCRGDNVCPGTQKCCSNGCGYTCQQPASKPGFCPLDPLGGQNIACVNLCKDDFSCPGSQKCCGKGCRRTCKSSLVSVPYAASDPCKRQVCGVNQVCQLQQVNCFRPPCALQPTCVGRISVSSNSVCDSGYPVLDISRRQITCQFPGACPSDTSCVTGICCWNEVMTIMTTPPPPPPPPTTTTTPKTAPVTLTCPSLFDVSLWFFCKHYPTCTTNASCKPDQSCCYAKGCGKRCLTLRS